MEKLLKEIENNLATLQCRLKECGIGPLKVEAGLWDTGAGFKVGVWTGVEWISLTGDCMHSIPRFIKLVERKKILFRKF